MLISEKTSKRFKKSNFFSEKFLKDENKRHITFLFSGEYVSILNNVSSSRFYKKKYSGLRYSNILAKLFINRFS